MEEFYQLFLLYGNSEIALIPGAIYETLSTCTTVKEFMNSVNEIVGNKYFCKSEEN